MMRGKLTIFILFCFYSQLVLADSTATKWELGVFGGVGHIWPHVSKVNYLQTSHIFHQQIEFSAVPTGDKEWHHRFNYTRYGVLASFSDFGNEEVGKAYSIVPFYNFTLLRKERSWLALRLGIGLGYLTQKWDKTENYKNIVIGSNVNASIDFAVNYQYQFLPHWSLVGIVALGHFSNAKYAAPNTGINYPVFLIGFSYRNYEKQSWKKQAMQKVVRQWVIESNFGVGVKENYAADENKYFSANVTGILSYQLTSKSLWGVAIDFVHDSGKIRLAKAEDGDYRTMLAYTTIGIGAAYQFKVNRTQYLFQLGTYVLNKEIMKEDFYNRLGIRHYLNDKVGVHVGIRNHRVNAQTLELGLIYKIK